MHRNTHRIVVKVHRYTPSIVTFFPNRTQNNNEREAGEGGNDSVFDGIWEVKWRSIVLPRRYVLNTGSHARCCSLRTDSMWIFPTTWPSRRVSLLSTRTRTKLRLRVEWVAPVCSWVTAAAETTPRERLKATVTLNRRAFSLKPFYLPREFENIIICSVYVPPPSGNAAQAPTAMYIWSPCFHFQRFQSL